MRSFTYPISHLLVFVLGLVFVFWSRFAGLGWGLPLAMHPDERNMVITIQQLSCPQLFANDCLHPHFFAYGQLPLYLAWVIGWIYQSMFGLISSQVSFVAATLALRLISASASVLTYLVGLKLFRLMTPQSNLISWMAIVFLTAVAPASIQFAHFGTTESLLMLGYILLLYEGVVLLKGRRTYASFVLLSGVYMGFSVGVKSSALLFVLIPFTSLALSAYQQSRQKQTSILALLFMLIRLMAVAIVFYIITSPYNLIAWQDFLGSMSYESGVGTGDFRAFYTRQFEDTIPFIFQMIHILPYALGGPLLLLFIFGFCFLPYKKEYIFLRMQVLFFALPTLAMYAKWTRFLAPVYPLMIFIAALYLARLLNTTFYGLSGKLVRIIGGIVMVISMIPGVAYMAVYRSPDVRTVASEWMYANIDPQAQILSETANVVDIPYDTPKTRLSMPQVRYHAESFRFYDLDTEPELKNDLRQWTENADYILIPSRRVFYNHTCFRPSSNGAFELHQSITGYDSSHCARMRLYYPRLHRYYRELFSGSIGFEQIAQFTSYPRISLFGQTIIEFPDEDAEETWTVFDHPVVRVFRKMK